MATMGQLLNSLSRL